MTIIGLPFLVVLIAVAATMVAATMVLWNRWPRWWAFPMRLLCLLLVMASGVAVAADVVNRSYGFYSSLDDLLGRVPAPVIVAARPVPDLHVAESAEGRVVQVRLSSARGAGMTREALVYSQPPTSSRPRPRGDFRSWSCSMAIPEAPATESASSTWRGSWMRRSPAAAFRLSSRSSPPTTIQVGTASASTPSGASGTRPTSPSTSQPRSVGTSALSTRPVAGRRPGTPRAASARSTSRCTTRISTPRRRPSPATTTPS